MASNNQSPRLQWEPNETNIALSLAGLKAIGLSAKDLYRFYTEGKPLKGMPTAWPWVQAEQTDNLHKWILPHIHDQTLRELCQSFAVQTQILLDTNDQWGQALAGFLKLPMPRTEADFEKLRKKLDRYRKKNSADWTAREEFQPLIAKSQQLIADTERLWLQLETRIRQVYPDVLPYEGDFGDQRAKDLIDQSMGQYPEVAIGLLRRALRYGHTGIQASKAYAELGSRYKQLGNTTRAIENYTKSLEAWREPNPMVLFWRGEFYYQEHQWKEARADFERALSLKWLLSPEREQAQEYLSKMDNV